MTREEKQKKTTEIVKQLLGMNQSKWNLLMFRNEPWVWAQYFLGLCLEMPTLVIIRRKDTAAYMPLLKHKLVKAFFEIDEFTKNTSEEVADKIAKYIKKHD